MTLSHFQPVLVAVNGMHRSGTSLLSGLLDRAGVWFGASNAFIATNDENPSGFFERMDVRSINDRILFAAGCDWAEVSDFDINRIPADALSTFMQDARKILKCLFSEAPYGVVGIKEPRLCLLMPLWLQCMDNSCIRVVIYRPAAEVALSLANRNGMPAAVAHDLHLRYISHLSALDAGQKDFFTSYQDCLKRPEEVVNEILTQLKDFGSALPAPDTSTLKSYVREDLYRSHVLSSDEQAQIPSDLVRALQSLGEGRFPAPMVQLPAPDPEVLAWQHRYRFERWFRENRRAQRLKTRLDRLTNS